MLFQFPPTIIYEVTDVSVITKIIDVSLSYFLLGVPIDNPTNEPLPNAFAPSRNDLNFNDEDLSFNKSP